MIWTIIVILLVAWVIGLVTVGQVGGVLHLLLLIALAIFVIRLLTGRNVA